MSTPLSIVKGQMAYVLMGIPGSGKSTYAKEFFSTIPVISSDAIRGELLGSETDQSNNAAVFAEVHKRIHDTIASGKDCVIDATNINAKSRKGIIKKIKDAAKDDSDLSIVAVYLDTPLDVCLVRNKARERVVPEAVIRRMHSSFVLPVTGEGFDAVIHVQPKNRAPRIILKHCEKCKSELMWMVNGLATCSSDYVNEMDICRDCLHEELGGYE